MLMYGAEKEKITFLSKIFYKLPVCEKDIDLFDSQCVSDIYKLLEGTQQLNKIELYSLLAKIVSLTENRVCTPDAIRVWLHKKNDCIIIRMNGVSNRTMYSKDDLQYLSEYQDVC